jgi:flagellar basal body-associated protein FliL
MSQKTYHKKKQASSRRLPWLWLAVGSALLLVAAGLAFIWSSNQPDPNFTPAVTSAPRLSVEQEEIDEGDIKFDKTVHTAFLLKNVGDQPLYIKGEPVVELVEGC